MYIFKYFIVTLTLFFVLVYSVSAAIIYMLPERGNFARGDIITVDIKIDSEKESINAAQGTINWSNTVLEFVDVSKDGSVFNFWVQDPELSSEKNSLSFIGGTAKGLSGGALQILKIRFKAIGAGTAELPIVEAVVTASDGRGTNVLSDIKTVTYVVGAAGTVPPTPAPTTPAAQPVIVKREAVPAKVLPTKSTLRVPLYQHSERWNNYLGETIVFWDLPPDVVAVAATVNHNPSTAAQTAEKELATGKSFGILEDGVWYIHVRFKNNIGWGPSEHYRVAIDTEPPVSFDTVITEGATTDNPSPTLQFRSSDALSGLKEYEIKVDNNEAIKIAVAEFTGKFIMPLQVPGIHELNIKAIDEAGNSVEDKVSLEILPIPSPTINFVTKNLFSEEQQGLTIKGTALPDINILLQVRRVAAGGEGEVAAKKTIQTSDKGNWEFTFDEPLRNGQYVVTVQAQDQRGALSLLVTSDEIKVKSKPIIQFGSLQLGKGGAALFLLLIIVGGFLGGAWFYKKQQERLSLRVSFEESEITKIFKLIQQDIDRLVESHKTPDSSDEEYAQKRLQENVKKMEAYLKKGVEKIQK